MTPSTTSSSATPRACASQHYDVTHHDLPLACPLPRFPVWNAHPRVYLPIEKTGHIRCPYCSATYTLTDFDPQQASDISP